MHLFCLSYAGGSANIYNKWKGSSDFIEVVPVELAGHGSRMREKLCSDFETIVNDVYEIICSKIKDNHIKAYALYGHSMGCWIAFEIARKLFLNSSFPNPVRLFFSGNCTPECRNYDIDMNSMDEDSFKEMIINYGGIPDILIEHQEILDLFMPVIKSDYYALAMYERKHKPFKFNCDISVFNGIDDEFEEREIYDWKNYAGRNFIVRNFNDGHFFINSLNKEVFESVCADLKESISEVDLCM